MRDRAGSAAAPAARCKNLRRGSFIVPSVVTHARTKPHFVFSEVRCSPTAPALPVAMIGSSARPAGCSQMKLHRLPARAEGGAMSLLVHHVANRCPLRCRLLGGKTDVLATLAK